MSPLPDSRPAAVYLINVVHVDAGQQDLALEVLRSAVGYVARTYPAFEWSRLYRSLDGQTVVNQALWSDQAAFESLFADTAFTERYNRLKDAGRWEFHLYHATDYIPRSMDESQGGLAHASDATPAHQRSVPAAGASREATEPDAS